MPTPVYLGDFTTALRAQLLDATAPYLWSDTVLEACTVDAVRQHSFLFPRSSLQAYDVTAGQQTITLSPSNAAETPDVTANGEVFAVLGVELPAGTPIPLDRWDSTAASRSSASRTANGYRWQGKFLRLRNPAAGAEVGPGTLSVEIWQTWDEPDAATTPWNGPRADYSLVLLLAKRAAYQLLAEWQAREQGIDPQTVTVPTGDQLVGHIDVAAILAALEVQITRELTLRARRTAVVPAQNYQPPAGA